MVYLDKSLLEYDIEIKSKKISHENILKIRKKEKESIKKHINHADKMMTF
nr:MAG: hypothetical protein [Lokiarchaeota virus Ratatoskr Meg22_1012]